MKKIKSKTPAALLNALHKLATFFHVPRKAAEATGAEGESMERFVYVKFVKPNGNTQPERQ